MIYQLYIFHHDPTLIGDGGDTLLLKENESNAISTYYILNIGSFLSTSSKRKCHENNAVSAYSIIYIARKYM